MMRMYGSIIWVSILRSKRAENIFCAEMVPKGLGIYLPKVQIFLRTVDEFTLRGINKTGIQYEII